MKDTKKKIEFFTFYDKTGIEAHLTGMAESSSFLKISINKPFPLTSFRSEGENHIVLVKFPFFQITDLRDLARPANRIRRISLHLISPIIQISPHNIVWKFFFCNFFDLD